MILERSQGDTLEAGAPARFDVLTDAVRGLGLNWQPEKKRIGAVAGQEPQSMGGRGSIAEGPATLISRGSGMSKSSVSSPIDHAELDRFYREGGLRAMAAPHVHYDDPQCPHAGCGHRMEWIAFKLELHGDPEGVSKPLVRAWWDGTGFVGRCPGCHGWIRFTTLKREAVAESDASRFPRLPDTWDAVAQFA